MSNDPASQMRDHSWAIHLVGKTIDARRAHKPARAEELVQFLRGIHVEQDVDVDTAILSHAGRIADYLYPYAFLSSASAAFLAPTPDGRLFISGHRNQRTWLRSEHASAVMGEMRVQMAVRLVEKYATPKKAADAVWALAREDGWYREGEGAEHFLLA